jgi:ankyrin repeat protein
MKKSLKIIPASFLICAATPTLPMAKVNTPNGAITQLHHAAFLGQTQEVRQLLAQGANVHARNCFGRTPLHDAVESLTLDTVSTLLSFGADPNVIDDDGMTPLFKAVKLNNPAIVEVLLKNKACPYAPVHTITPLHHAAYTGNLDIIKLLLTYKAFRNAQNMWKRTPLHDALQITDIQKCIKVCAALIDENTDLRVKDCDGNTPVFLAIKKGDDAVEIVDLLLQHGADFNAGINSITPLHYAAFNGHHKLVELLCRYGAQANAQNFLGKTPLHDALDSFYAHNALQVRNFERIIQLLIAQNARTDIADEQGRTPQSIDEKGIEEVDTAGIKRLIHRCFANLLNRSR